MFGWRSLAAAYDEYWWLYAAIVVISALISAWDATSVSYHTEGIEWTATFAVLATGTRVAVPSFRMNVVFVLQVAGIWLLFILVPAIVLAPIVAAVFFLHWFAPLWTLFAIIPLIVWATVKVWLAPILYALHRNEGATVFEAVAQSWKLTAGIDFWRVFFLLLSIGFIMQALPSYLMVAIITSLFEKDPFWVALAASLLYFAAAVLATIWSTLSLIALASALRWKTYEAQPAG